MDLGIAGKVALVTGASKGLGLGVASELALEGARVGISSRSRERIESAAQRIGAHGFVHDASDIHAVPGLVEQVQQQLGPIDIVVANCGGPAPNPDALGFTLDQWRDAYEKLL